MDLEFRFGRRTAQPDPPHWTECKVQCKGENDHGRDGEQPVCALERPGLGRRQVMRRGIRKDQTHRSEQDDQACAEKKDRVMDVQPCDFDIVLADFVVGFINKQGFFFGGGCFGCVSSRYAWVEILNHTRLLP